MIVEMASCPNKKSVEKKRRHAGLWLSEVKVAGPWNESIEELSGSGIFSLGVISV